MERFGRVLRRAESGLRIPGARRARILTEMAQDLEDAYRAYLSRGLGEEESVRRAEQLLGLSEPAVAELERVHGTWYGRVVGRFSARGAHRMERVVLAGLTALAIALVAGALMATGGPDASPVVVCGLLGVLAAAVALVAGEWLTDLRGAAPRGSRFGAMLGLAAGALVMGALGALRELWRLAGGEVGAAGPGGAGAAGVADALGVVAAIGRAAEVLALGVVVALFGVVAGFHLRSRRRASVWRRPAVRPRSTRAVPEGDEKPHEQETQR